MSKNSPSSQLDYYDDDDEPEKSLQADKSAFKSKKISPHTVSGRMMSGVGGNIGRDFEDVDFKRVYSIYRGIQRKTLLPLQQQTIYTFSPHYEITMKAVEENIKTKKGIFNLSSSFFYSSVLVFYFILFSL